MPSMLTPLVIMSTIGTILIILLVVAILLVLWAVGMYNGFVRSRNMIQESWRQVDVELNRRYELIPNLVETVRAFAAHERNTLEQVTALRNQAAQLARSEGDTPSQQRADVEGQLTGAVRNLLVSVEAYPELKSNVNFLELQKQLTETEDRIAAGRRFYNANVRVYNTKVDSVPTNILANMFHFEKATYFEVNDQAVRQAPDVNFGEISYRGDASEPDRINPDQPQALPQQSSNSDLPNPQAGQAPSYQQPPQAQGYTAPEQQNPQS